MKVPLLEYLDKLEADVRKADALATMHRPHAAATLALIAKLREYHKRLAGLCNDIAQSSEDPDDLDDVRVFLRDGIEVPE